MFAKIAQSVVKKTSSRFTRNWMIAENPWRGGGVERGRSAAERIFLSSRRRGRAATINCSRTAYAQDRFSVFSWNFLDLREIVPKIRCRREQLKTDRVVGCSKMALVVKAREIESEDEIQRVYNWMDDIRLSRPRR